MINKYFKNGFLFTLALIFINCINDKKGMLNEQNIDNQSSIKNTLREDPPRENDNEESTNIIYINNNYEKYNNNTVTPTKSNINEYPYLEYNINRVGLKSSQNSNIKDLDIIVDKSNDHLNLYDQKTDDTVNTNNTTPSIGDYIGLSKNLPLYSEDSNQTNSSITISSLQREAYMPKTPRNSMNTINEKELNNKSTQINLNIRNALENLESLNEDNREATPYPTNMIPNVLERVNTVSEIDNDYNGVDILNNEVISNKSTKIITVNKDQTNEIINSIEIESTQAEKCKCFYSCCLIRFFCNYLCCCCNKNCYKKENLIINTNEIR